MKKTCFVGIDTSNYTTSAAVADADGNILLNYKKLLAVGDGKCGLRQSDAVFAHVKNLPDAMKCLGDVVREYEILAVGVSEKPRDAELSYMPCFLSGVAAASAISRTADVPLYRFSHQNGHLMAAIHSSGFDYKAYGKTFGAFHVSGGTTEMLYVTPLEEGFSVSLAGETADLNAGQAIDRAGVAMGFGFPCGAEMEKKALLCDEKIKGLSVSVKDGRCNLSGLENTVARFIAEGRDYAYISRYVFEFVAKTLVRMTETLVSQKGDMPVLYAGGVMSNSIIKARIGEKFNAYFAKPEFSSDNAAGIALLAKEAYENRKKDE